VEELRLGVVRSAAPLEQLDRHRPREHTVARFEHPGEAAPADLAHQLEAAADDHSWSNLGLQRSVRVDWSPGDLTKERVECRVAVTFADQRTRRHSAVSPSCDRYSCSHGTLAAWKPSRRTSRASSRPGTCNRPPPRSCAGSGQRSSDILPRWLATRTAP